MLTTTTAVTTPKQFQIFGDTDPSGTINMALLPGSVNEIEFFGYQTGALTINNAPAVFTLDVQAYAVDEITVDAANTVATTNLGFPGWLPNWREYSSFSGLPARLT